MTFSLPVNMAELLRFFFVRKSSISLLLVLYLLSLKVSADRKVTIQEIWCPSKICTKSNYSIIHVTADSKERNNSIHYLYSTIHSPTIVVAYFEHVPGPITLTVDWGGLIKMNRSHTLKFNQKFKHLMAFVVPRLIAFEDPKDELYYTETHVKDITTHSLENVTWDAPKIDYATSSVDFTGHILDGNIIFQCNVSSTDGREEVLPSLLYTSNSTRFTFTLTQLKGLDTSSKHQTRLGLELFSITPRSNSGSTCVKGSKSIDDEYTPAVFKTVVVNNTGTSGNSYVAWKPVAYTSDVRNLKKQVPSYEYLVTGHFNAESDCKPVTVYPVDFESIAFAFEPHDMNAYGVNVSFGQAKDGWYQNKRYLSWTGLIGYGEPHFDTFSMTVLIAIIVGLGAPLVVLICGGVFVGVKKYKENKMTSAYSRIN